MSCSASFIPEPDAMKPSTVPYPTTGRSVTDAGMTMIEVMITVFILTIGIMGIYSSLPGLSSARQMSIELAQVQQLVAILQERLQGAAWSDLGGQGTGNDWSKPRYRDATTPVNPPMVDTAASSSDDLQSLGVIGVGSKVRDLKLYVEYYQGALLDDSTITNRTLFLSKLTPANRLINFSTASVSNNSAVVRILATWKETAAGKPEFTHEIFVARKQ